MNLFYFFLSNLKLIIIFIFRETPELNHHFNLEDDSDEEEEVNIDLFNHSSINNSTFVTTPLKVPETKDNGSTENSPEKEFDERSPLFTG